MASHCTELGQFCEDGRVSLASRLDVGLQIGRGMPYWVNAEDLLLAANAMTTPQRATLDGFLDLDLWAAVDRIKFLGRACLYRLSAIQQPCERSHFGDVGNRALSRQRGGVR